MGKNQHKRMLSVVKKIGSKSVTKTYFKLALNIDELKSNLVHYKMGPKEIASNCIHLNLF